MDFNRRVIGPTAMLLTMATVCQWAWAQDGIRPSDAHVAAAELAITEPALRGHIRFLADDLLEGRGPGSRGDELAQRYMSHPIIRR